MIERLEWESWARGVCQDGGKGVLAIDFDDTLTAPGGIEALPELRTRGYGLMIYTANADLEGIQAWIDARWPEGVGDSPRATHQKPQCVAFIDDKAHRFTDWADVLGTFQ